MGKGQTAQFLAAVDVNAFTVTDEACQTVINGKLPEPE